MRFFSFERSSGWVAITQHASHALILFRPAALYSTLEKCSPRCAESRHCTTVIEGGGLYIQDTHYDYFLIPQLRRHDCFCYDGLCLLEIPPGVSFGVEKGGQERRLELNDEDRYFYCALFCYDTPREGTFIMNEIHALRAACG